MFSFSYTYVVCMGACPNHGPKSDFTWASASTLRCIIYGQRPQTELLKCHFSFHLMVAAQSDLCDNTVIKVPFTESHREDIYLHSLPD